MESNLTGMVPWKRKFRFFQLEVDFPWEVDIWGLKFNGEIN
jgi:hypothetical protein